MVAADDEGVDMEQQDRKVEESGVTVSVEVGSVSDSLEFKALLE